MSMEILGMRGSPQGNPGVQQSVELTQRMAERRTENQRQRVESQQKVAQGIASSRDEIHKKIQEAVDRMDTYSGSLQKKFKYTINDDIDQVVVKIIDPDTDKVIKELPAAELQKLQARIQEYLGLLIDETI
ncbi:flagellar protein FlaG [Spirochaeta lutea]|uniref:flagellar protein FlaG n=1 Tax=Spirochaeta lutea TaxID=1480694 RepID=UPI00068D90CF|nr:flagellar protein FlaG [Spirochaeta lutea]